MLRSLLRYDFRAVLKYWWIAVISLVVLSLLGGLCIRVLEADMDLPSSVISLAVFGLLLIFLGFAAFYLLSMIAIFVRYYKNFFTDEGYLTFTLPAKPSQLLNSKLIMSTVTLFGVFVVIMAGFGLMMTVGLGDTLLSLESRQSFLEGWSELSHELGAYFPLYGLEMLVLIVLCFAFFSLLVFACITFGSIITRKGKVLASIGIYYGVNSVLSFLMQMLQLFTMPSLIAWMADLQDGQIKVVIALVLLGMIALIALLCMLLYCLVYWMLDRKLNLS